MLRQAASGFVYWPLMCMVIGPQPHMAHAQDGQGGFAAQRQVTLHTRVKLMRPSSEMTPPLLGKDRPTKHLVVAMQMADDHLQHILWEGCQTSPAMRTKRWHGRS